MSDFLIINFGLYINFVSKHYVKAAIVQHPSDYFL